MEATPLLKLTKSSVPFKPGLVWLMPTIPAHLGPRQEELKLKARLPHVSSLGLALARWDHLKKTEQVIFFLGKTVRLIYAHAER